MQAEQISWKKNTSSIKVGLNRSCGSVIYPAAEPNCWCEADSLGVGGKPEKVMGACLLLLSPESSDRAWSQGLAKALVLELAPNQTHDWLFSHKACSQIRWLTITLLSIVGPRIRGLHFFSPPQVCHPPHVEFTPSNNVSHYFSAWQISLSTVCNDFDSGLVLDIYQTSLLSSHHNVNA